MIRRAYAELHASGVQNFSQFEDTLLPRNLVVLKQFFNGNWHDWTFEFPTNNAQPGRGGELPPTSDYITMTLEWLLQMVLGWRSIRALDRVEQSLRDGRSSELWQQTLGRFERLFDAASTQSLRLAWQLAQRLRDQGLRAEPALVEALQTFRTSVWTLLSHRIDDDLQALRRWILVDYACTTLIGVINDKVLEPGGFAAIDQYDFRAWLKRHGGSPQACYSPIVALWRRYIGQPENPRSPRSY